MLTSTASCGKPQYLNLITPPGDRLFMYRTGTVGKVLFSVWNKPIREHRLQMMKRKFKQNPSMFQYDTPSTPPPFSRPQCCLLHSYASILLVRRVILSQMGCIQQKTPLYGGKSVSVVYFISSSLGVY